MTKETKVATEVEELKNRVEELESALGDSLWQMWDLQRVLANMASQLTDEIDREAVPHILAQAFLDIEIVDAVDILYPDGGIFRTKCRNPKDDVVLTPEESQLIPVSDGEIARPSIQSLQHRWNDFNFCYVVHLKEFNITRALILVWRRKTMLDPDRGITETLVSVCRMSYGFQAIVHQEIEAWRQILRDHAELLRMPLHFADTINDQLTASDDGYIQLEYKDALEVGRYLHELDLASTRTLVLAGELSDDRTLHHVDLEEVMKFVLENVPAPMRSVVSVNAARNAKAWLRMPLFAFALRDVIWVLWKYGNGREGISVKYGKEGDKVFFELWSEGKGFSDDVRREVLGGRVLFYPRGHYYGQGVLAMGVCKKIIEEFHSVDGRSIGTFREIGNERKMHFQIKVDAEALNPYATK